MTNSLKTLALAAALAAGTSSLAFAQACPPGYGWNGAACAPLAAPAPGYAYAPNNPVSGAAAGGAAGAAAGGAAAGPVGAIVGGALGTATGAVGGTINGVTGTPAYQTPAYGSSAPPAPGNPCGPGRVLYLGTCYPAD
jgi:hypothetical protein